jgi:hypothetical protein
MGLKPHCWERGWWGCGAALRGLYNGLRTIGPLDLTSPRAVLKTDEGGPRGPSPRTRRQFGLGAGAPLCNGLRTIGPLDLTSFGLGAGAPPCPTRHAKRREVVGWHKHPNTRHRGSRWAAPLWCAWLYDAESHDVLNAAWGVSPRRAASRPHHRSKSTVQPEPRVSTRGRRVVARDPSLRTPMHHHAHCGRAQITSGWRAALSSSRHSLWRCSPIASRSTSARKEEVLPA